ncbi:MAG: hypothetical protein IT260_21965 [Saprospiraceae bacterium]|nr:hypothetical protein [Saprospiraceae bacterium]
MQQDYSVSIRANLAAWLKWLVLVAFLYATNPSGERALRGHIRKQEGFLTVIQEIKAFNLLVLSVDLAQVGLFRPSRRVYLGVCGTFIELGRW